MRGLSSELLGKLNDRYGSDAQLVVRFRSRKYGPYDAGDENYNISLPTMEGRLTEIGALVFKVNQGSNTVVCEIDFSVCDTSEAILGDLLANEFSRLDSCKVGVTASGQSDVEWIFTGFIADPISWDYDRKTFKAHFTSDYTKRKIGYVFRGTECAYPNRAEIGNALPTVFGSVGRSPCMPIQTGCIGQLAEDVLINYTTYPAIQPVEVKVTNLNIPMSIFNDTEGNPASEAPVDTNGNTLPVSEGYGLTCYLGGVVVDAVYHPRRPGALTLIRVHAEVSGLLRMPEIDAQQITLDENAMRLKVATTAGWYIENQYAGLLVPNYSDTLSDTMGALPEAFSRFLTVNYATVSAGGYLGAAAAWVGADGGPLYTQLVNWNAAYNWGQWAAENEDVVKKLPVAYLSPVPPDELYRISNGAWEGPTYYRELVTTDANGVPSFSKEEIECQIVDCAPEYKDIKQAYKQAVEIDSETEMLRIKSSTKLMLLKPSTSSFAYANEFVPDIYVVNHSKLPTSGQYTALPGGTTEITASIPYLYYKVEDNGVQFLRELTSGMPQSNVKATTYDTTSFPGYAATLVELAVPLGAFGSDELYADVISNISANTADQLRRFIELETFFTMDETTWQTCHTDCNSYPSCWTLTDDRARYGVIKVMSELAYRANIGLVLGSDAVKLKYIATAKEADATIGTDDVVIDSYRIEFANPQDTPTLFRGTYAEVFWEWSQPKLLKRALKQIGAPENHQNESTIEYYNYNYINNVKKSLEYIALREGYKWAYVVCKVPMHFLKLEIFDYITIDLPDISTSIGVLEEMSIDAAEMLIELRIRVNKVSGD